MPTVNPYWLKPPWTRPRSWPTSPCFFHSGPGELILWRLARTMKIDIFPTSMPRRYFDRCCRSRRRAWRSRSGCRASRPGRRRAASQDHGSLRGLRAGADPGQPAHRDRRRARPEPELARLANDGMAEDRRPAPRPLSGIRRLAAHEQSRCRRARDRPRDRRPLRRPGCRSTRTSRGGRSTCRIPADLRPDGAARSADLDASRARPPSPTTRASRDRSSTCGGRSAGRTRRRWRWGGWSSRASSTGIPG